MEETTTPAADSIYKHAAKFGAILGGISLVMVILFYAVDVSFMATFKFLGLISVISIGFVIYSGINYRSSIGGYLPYGKAFVHAIVLLATAGVISTIFNIILYHVIDTELADNMAATIAENTEKMMANFGAPQEKIDETIEKMKVDLPQQFSVGGLLLGYLKSLIWYVVLAVITSIFVRKNEPVEM